MKKKNQFIFIISLFLKDSNNTIINITNNGKEKK